MFIFNISSPLTLVLSLIIMVLIIFLAQELKKSYIAAIVLFISLIMLVVHGVQMFTLQEEYKDLLPILVKCLVIDFIFVGISFFAYLWVDDTEAREKGIKSVDNSLDWFWKRI